MERANQRIVARGLLVSMFLQSCGVDVPVGQFKDEESVTVKATMVLERAEGSSGPPTMHLESFLTTVASSPAPSESYEDHAPTEPGFRDIPPAVLLHHVGHSDITSTKQLVKAYNTAQDREQRQALHEWLRAYVKWFAHSQAQTLDDQQIQEYTHLSRIKPVTGEDQALLYQYFTSLAMKVEQNTFGDKHLIEAFEDVLQTLSPFVFGKRTDELISVGICLLDKIRPADTEFSKVNYPKHGAILTTLYTTLLLIRELDTEGWSDSEGGLYQDFQEEVLAIKKVSRYYPVTYYSYLLSKSLEALRVSNARLGVKVWQGIKALARCYDVGRKLVDLGRVPCRF
ncbi:MAG: hypothetical protein AAFV97_00430 [Bacteroidota bacterium]